MMLELDDMEARFAAAIIDTAEEDGDVGDVGDDGAEGEDADGVPGRTTISGKESIEYLPDLP